jgi:dihydroflavonol-4-reductase
MEPNPRFWAGRTVCVTGGTGFLGYHLVQQLLPLGAQVRVFALRPSGAHPLLRLDRVEAEFGDVCDPAAVRRAVAGCAAVFHTAGTVAAWGPSLRRMHAVHVDGTANVLAAADRDAAVVHTSSVVAVGAAKGGRPCTEDDPFDLDGLRVDYVQAKRAAEQVALTSAAGGRRVVVTNPGYLVGPEDHEGSVMGRLCRRFWRGRVPLAPPGGFCLADVRDVARGHLLAAEHGRPGRRYILGGENRTFRGFLRELARAAGRRPRGLGQLPGWAMFALAALGEGLARLTGKEPYPSFQHARLNAYRWFASSDRAEGELGYRSRPLRECLADAYRWHRADGAWGLHGPRRRWLRGPAEPPVPRVA